MKQKHIEILEKREAELADRLDRSWGREAAGPVLGPVLGTNTIGYQVSEKTRAIAGGGLGLVQSIDRRVRVLKRPCSGVRASNFSFRPATRPRPKLKIEALKPVYEVLVSYDVYLVHPEHAPFLPSASERREESCLRVVHFLGADWCTFRVPAPLV